MLALPYLALIESIIYFRFYDFDPDQKTVLMNANFIWNLLALFWFVPYTILAICLLIWSRNKTVEEIRNTYMIAPFMLMFLSGGLYLLINIVGLFFEMDGMSIFMIATGASMAASLLIGYIFVGVSLVIIAILKRIKLVRD
jgi:hypothetical protein